MSERYALVLAGGSGSRLWPLQHKPLLALIGEKSLFEQTIERLNGVVARENILVVTDEELVPHLHELAPDLRYVCEPSPRDTAAAVGLGLLEIARRDPDALVAVLSSDHFIADAYKLRAALRTGYDWAERGAIALLGALPTFPATGYGYIVHGESVTMGENVDCVEAFIEKPSATTARQLLEAGRCSWDAGIFVASAQVLLDEYARQQPQMLACLRDVDASRWQQITPISLDYAIMEGARNRVVIRLDTAWSDVGNWGALVDVLPKDGDGNTLSPNVIAIHTRGVFVCSDKPTAVIGLEDIIVVETAEGLLICHRDQAQAVRQIAKLLVKTD
ncbi:MAG: mannose-1-phosphate guanylyltransferase [Burkholderiales bacterium]|nr:mannose-1-phosphate guanylyltransferase [Anaerolineae bacterium]